VYGTVAANCGYHYCSSQAAITPLKQEAIASSWPDLGVGQASTFFPYIKLKALGGCIHIADRLPLSNEAKEFQHRCQCDRAFSPVVSLEYLL